MTDSPPENQDPDPQPSSGSLYQAYIIHAYEHRAYPLLPEESLFIGRGSRCDIVLREVFVSRNQVEIRPEGSGHVAHPTGSNPTLVNNIPISAPRLLKEGDVINIGTMRFIYTQERLPVAMQVADPYEKSHRLYDEVSDRRPTLSFPVQSLTQQHHGKTAPRKRYWILGLIVLIIVAAIAHLVYWGYLDKWLG